jgi:hypothetical protein
MSKQKDFPSKEFILWKENALTANVSQRSRQTLVFLLHRKVVLAYIGETFDNMLHQRQRESALRLWIRGQAHV